MRTPSNRPAQAATDCPTPVVVRLRRVSAEYDRERVLHGISAEVRSGTITAVTGANGAGKSTLLAVLAGIHRPIAGEVDGLAGRPVAYVPQRSAVPEHFPVTARDVASMGRWPALRHRWARLDARDRRIVDASLDRLDVLPLAPRSFGELSGGQRQRVLIAQALAREAELLLLDEPTVGLDLAAGRAIRAVLRAEADRGATVVEVTHDPLAVTEADARLHLESGHLVPALR